MSEFSVPTVYFRRPGPENTDRALALARERAEALGIKQVVVATTSGAAAVRAAELLPGFDIVAVTHSTGIRAPDAQELTPENRAQLVADGVTILTCQHAFGGVGRAIRKKLGTYEIEEVIAHTFRIFGQGMKVVFEIVLMAADAGLISTQSPAVVVAGTGHGADTVVIVQPANAQSFFELRPLEIVCMPAPHHPAFGSSLAKEA